MKPNLEKKIRTDTLFAHIPHRPPMVWIDYILDFSADGGTGLTIVKDGELYMSAGELRRSVCIELIAQTFAFNNAAVYMSTTPSRPPTQKAFLAAIKDFKIGAWPEIPLGSELKTVVKRDRSFGPITIIHGTTTLNDVVLATGELKVFAE